MKFELKPYNRDIPDEEFLTDLKRVSELLKKSVLSSEEYKKYGKYSSDVCRRRFGSWNNALKKVGLKRSRNYGISEEELFQDLEELWTKLGRQPNYSEMGKPLSKYSSHTFVNRFGSWRKGLGKFVSYISNEENVSSKEAIQNLEIESSTRHKTKRNINWRLRFIVMRRDNFKCKKCGRSPATDPTIILHVDHKTAWTNGGETVLENLDTLCSICNIGKSDLE
jgi:predicted restriction endonuclease